MVDSSVMEVLCKKWREGQKQETKNEEEARQLHSRWLIGRNSQMRYAVFLLAIVPAIDPELIPIAEITSYKPTNHPKPNLGHYSPRSNFSPRRRAKSWKRGS